MTSIVLVSGGALLIGGAAAYRYFLRGPATASGESAISADMQENSMFQDRTFLNRNADAYFHVMQLTRHKKFDTDAFEVILEAMNDLCDISSGMDRGVKYSLGVLRECQDLNVRLQDASRILEKAVELYDAKNYDRRVFQDLTDFGKDIFFNLSQYTRNC